MKENAASNSFQPLRSVSLPVFLFLLAFHSLYSYTVLLFCTQHFLQYLYWSFTLPLSFDPVCVILKMHSQLMYKVCSMYHLFML